MKNILILLWAIVLLAGCATRKSYNPSQKLSPEALQKDYALFRTILEESHPSLYWYTPKDSVDASFNQGASMLRDSLPEFKFRNILSAVISKIRCGHTSIIPSAAAIRYSERTRSFALPLSVKAWPDTVLVTSNLNRKDTVVTRGVILRSIEGRPIQKIIDSFFSHLSADGYNTTHKYQTLSNGGVFRNLYGSIYGLHTKMKVEYLDSAGQLQSAVLNVYNPNNDTPRIALPAHRPSARERRRMALQSTRNLRIDTSLHTAFMELNAFTKHNKLRSFFRRSFRELRKQSVKNLVVDLRGNGGGSVVLSNLLTKYLAKQPFKIADSIYALKRRSSYGRYIESYWENRLFLLLMVHRKSDGFYHFSLYENKYFKPKQKNHFDGTVYILTGGNTFSAATLFAKTLREQENVYTVGEETGGGAYGNTAWLIPEVTLPHTGVRFRLPLFRLVIDKKELKGRGVMPEIEALPNTYDIRRNVDYKMEKIYQLLRKDSTSKE